MSTSVFLTAWLPYFQPKSELSQKNCIQLKVKSIKWCQLRCWDNWRFSIKWVQMYFPPSDIKNKNLHNHNKIASKIYGCAVLSEWVGLLSDNQGHNSVMSAKSWSKLSFGSARRAICQLWQPACRNWILTFGPKSNRILTGSLKWHHFFVVGVFEWCTGWRHLEGGGGKLIFNDWSDHSGEPGSQ